jgi:predicted nucleic acid-binding protein
VDRAGCRSSGATANPTASGPAQAAQSWARAKIADGHHLVVAEISDYEVRRELLRAERSAAIARLDAICAGLGYAPITTIAMRDAARLWADARNSGRPTAYDHALDGDVILAAQARTLPVAPDETVVVATTNPAHLALYVTAAVWTDL